jgi:predicted AAA+ superfamily ATPase
MSPLLVSEACEQFADIERLWLRGGFPNSLLAPTDTASWDWRDALIRHFLNTDLAQLGINVEPELMRRYWRMLAHLHGQLFNASSIAMSLGVAASTATRYLDHLCNALMVRRLEPHHINIGKRLVKSPKVYVRDSGLLHSLLSIQSVNDLLGHPSTGASWEGFVIEQIAAHMPAGASLSFYRTAAGAEMDAVVEMGRVRMGFEVKFSSAPKSPRVFGKPVRTYNSRTPTSSRRWPKAGRCKTGCRSRVSRTYRLVWHRVFHPASSSPLRGTH